MKNQTVHATYVLTATLMLNIISLASASPIPLMDPFYEGRYVLTDLGAPPGLPGGIGGLALKPGDPNTLLIGGDTISPLAAIYQYQVTRGVGNHIVGFAGAPTLFASAPWAETFAYGPDGVLFYTTYSNYSIGQLKPGSTVPDKILSMPGLGLIN